MLYADNICPQFNKLCQSCGKHYPSEMAVCLKDRTMLSKLEWEYEENELDAWLMHSRFFGMQHCTRCHEHFTHYNESFCPKDNSKLVACIPNEVDGPALEDRYVLKSFMGKGRMTSAFYALDRDSGEPRVVKFLRPDLCADEQTVSRFLSVSRTAMMLNDPQIVRTYSADIAENGTPYVVTQYLAGHSLKEELQKRGRLDTVTALNIFIDALKGLQYAHQNKTMHTNITPSNIFVVQKGAWASGVLVDFGAADRLFRTLEWREGEQSTGENLYGDPSAICPEYTAGKKPSPPSDIYQLGCCFYEALNGRPPFRRDRSIAVVMAHAQQAPDPFDARANISDTLKSVVLECLNKDPEDRYQSAAELIAVLEECRSGGVPQNMLSA